MSLGVVGEFPGRPRRGACPLPVLPPSLPCALGVCCVLFVVVCVTAGRGATEVYWMLRPGAL